MANDTFVKGIKQGEDIRPDQNIFDAIFEEYGRVIFESLITSFGLDLFIKDIVGGDVDTVYNARNLKDENGDRFKKSKYNDMYEKIGKYDPVAYHQDARYRDTVTSARKEFDSRGTMIDDAYVPGNHVIPRNNPTIDRGRQGQLDHIIPARKVHEDPGRVLAGVNGIDLANDSSNLAYTNAALNRNKSDMSTEEYLAWAEANPEKVNWNGKKGEPIPEEIKAEMRQKTTNAQKAMDAKINRTYYTSKAFWADTRNAAVKRGVQMGLRQAMGFFLAEVVCTIREEIRSIPSGLDLKGVLLAIEKGVKKGFENALKNQELAARFAEGALAGAVASLTTTISNIFFTTSQNLVRCIRQMYASIIQASKILFMNPDNLYMGERIKKTAIILATGASVVVGTNVSSLVAKTPIGSMQHVGPAVCTFSATLVSGLLSCSLLLFMDRSKFMNSLVERMNEIPSEANNYAEVAEAFERLAAKMSSLDIEKFKRETKQYDQIANSIINAESEEWSYVKI